MYKEHVCGSTQKFSWKTDVVINASDGSGATFVSRFTAAGASHLLHCLLLNKAGLSLLKKVFLKKVFTNFSDTEEIQSVIPNIFKHHGLIRVLSNIVGVKAVLALEYLYRSKINKILFFERTNFIDE